MEQSKLHPVMEYGIRQGEAIKCLREKGYKQATLVLLFAAIDQLAWVADEKERVGRKGFKDWVQRYMIEISPDLLPGATTADLWGARCGILHTGATESDEQRDNGARRIFYTSNLGQSNARDSNFLILSLEGLGAAFVNALGHFYNDLRLDSAADARARVKLDRMLVDQSF